MATTNETRNVYNVSVIVQNDIKQDVAEVFPERLEATKIPTDKHGIEVVKIRKEIVAPDEQTASDRAERLVHATLNARSIPVDILPGETSVWLESRDPKRIRFESATEVMEAVIETYDLHHRDESVLRAALKVLDVCQNSDHAQSLNAISHGVAKEPRQAE